MATNFPNEPYDKLEEYRKFVLNLECTKDKDTRTRLDHAITGLVTESGELSGLMKKIKFYGAEVPKINFLDELGDLLWYLVTAMNTFEITLEDLIRLNMTKLKARHPNGITFETAMNKNKGNEREAMVKEIEEIMERKDESN